MFLVSQLELPRYIPLFRRVFETETILLLSGEGHNDDDDGFIDRPSRRMQLRGVWPASPRPLGPFKPKRGGGVWVEKPKIIRG